MVTNYLPACPLVVYPSVSDHSFYKNTFHFLLQKNFESEKEALLGMLKGTDSRLDNERQRQLALARLRREAKKAQAEEKYDAAALVLGMAKSQQASLSAK